MDILMKRALLFCLIFPYGFDKRMKNLPAATGSDTGTHWFQLSEGADEAFHSELWPFLLLIGHVVLPYNLQYLLEVSSISLPRPCWIQKYMTANESVTWYSKISLLKIPDIKQCQFWLNKGYGTALDKSSHSLHVFRKEQICCWYDFAFLRKLTTWPQQRILTEEKDLSPFIKKFHCRIFTNKWW